MLVLVLATQLNQLNHLLVGLSLVAVVVTMNKKAVQTFEHTIASQKHYLKHTYAYYATQD
jgi:hypothetical protein